MTSSTRTKNKTDGTAKRATRAKESTRFTPEERAAMNERVRELKRQAHADGHASPADGEAEVLARIAEMPEPDRVMAQRLHALMKTSAPTLRPRTWYGMPAYAKDGQIVCFFQSAAKFKSRYATVGFTDKANLDQGAMWATSFALKALTDVEEARIAALLEKALQ